MRVYFNPLCVGSGQGRRPLTQIKRLWLSVWYLRFSRGCRKEATTCTRSVSLSLALIPFPSVLVPHPLVFLLCWLDALLVSFAWLHGSAAIELRRPRIIRRSFINSSRFLDCKIECGACTFSEYNARFSKKKREKTSSRERDN